MKKLTLLAICISLASCSKDPNVAVRIDCGAYNDKGLQATLNGQPVGDCPVDIMVHAGEVHVSVRKDNEDASYLFAEEKMTLAENAMKRIKLDIQPVLTEEYYYRKSNDLPGMKSYLLALPDGQRRKEVTDKLEQHYFSMASDESGMLLYLKELPEGKRRKEVSDKLEGYYFDNATNITGMQTYLNKQPDGKRRVEVEARLKAERSKLGNFAPDLVMIPIPSGSFIMGCSEGDNNCWKNEKPERRVTVSAFKLSKTEVTFKQYDLFAKATKRKLPDDSGWGRGNRPVINVSWHDAVAYIKWLREQTGQQFRLPSEAEWEYAARAGSTSIYNWGNSIECSNARFNGGKNTKCHSTSQNSGYRGTAEVGSFNANRFGLYDIHGNVWEWTQDCWNSNYNNAPINGNAWQNGECESRVMRGGSWADMAEDVRSSKRINQSSNSRDYHYGFRIAQD